MKSNQEPLKRNYVKKFVINKQPFGIVFVIILLKTCFMRNILLGFSVLLSTVAIAQEPNATRTSIANGNATSPFTWDCTCIPIPGDNVIINTNVILDNNWAYSSGSLTINSGKSLTGNAVDRILAVNGGTFTNNGTTSIALIYHNGGTFVNNGTLNITESFANGGTVTTTNNQNMTVSDSLYIVATLTNNHTLSAFGTANSGTFNNNGGFTTGDFWNSGTINNTGLPGLHMTNDIYSSGTINNSTQIMVDNDFMTSENVTNSDYIVIGNDLYTGDSVQLTANFTNNGLVSVGAGMYSNQTVDGNGDFCVAGTTANSGTINGTLDICDLTGGSIDLNVGTIASTVTYCTNSCAVGVHEEENQEVKIYPNPFENRLIVNVEGYENVKFSLQNILGQKLISQNISGKTEIPVADFESGVYFYTVIADNKIVSSGKLLKE